MRTLVPAYPAVTAKLDDVSIAREYNDLFGGPARVLLAPSPRASISSRSTLHISTTGPAIPISGPDGLDWPDNARRFAALARVGADIGLGAHRRLSSPRSSTRTTGRPRWRAAYLHFAVGRAARDDGHDPQSCLSGPLSDFDVLRNSACPTGALSIDGVEYFGGVGYLKAGLRLADAITTVSPTYAREIMTPEFGMALDGLLALARLGRPWHSQRHRRRRLESRRRPALPQNYSALRIDMRRAQQDGAAEQARTDAERRPAAVRRRLAPFPAEGPRPAAAGPAALVAKGGQLRAARLRRKGARAGLRATPPRRRPVRSAASSATTRRLAHLFQAGGGFHCRAIPLRTVRADAALRAPLWRDADRLTRRRSCRHRHRRQRRGDRRRRRDRRPVLTTLE